MKHEVVAVEVEKVEVAVEAAPVDIAALPVVETVVAAETSPETLAPDAAPVEKLPAEKVDVVVWWPQDQGPFKKRPPRHDNHRRSQNVAEPASAEPGEKPAFHKKPRRPGKWDAKPAATSGTAGDGATPVRVGFKGKGRPAGPRPDHARPERPRFDAPRDRPRDKPMDPNSPFAILGALKASMGSASADKKEDDKS